MIIETAQGSATGFFVGSEGYVLTCAHILPMFGGPNVLYNFDVKGEGVKVRTVGTLVRIAEAQDLALLKISVDGPVPAIRLETGREVEMGDSVTVIGHPGLGSDLLEYTMTTGIVRNPKRTIEGAPFIQTNASVNPGSSGSPMFNSRGNVIGLVVLKARIEAVGFAVPHKVLANFLQSATKEEAAPARPPKKPGPG